MEYTRLGRSGLEVSRVCLGGMSYGDTARGGHTWAVGADVARPLIRQAVEAGINFFDTANVYSGGSSEEILGEALSEFAVRDELVIATKIMGRTRPGPNGGGLSRKAIFADVDHSLRRLKVDYIDLLQVHRWDDFVPIEETLEALHDVVSAGKARYLGASTMFAWQFSKALYVAERNGWTRFISMQDHYNLLYREEEREMFGLCEDWGIAIVPWSPLARGRLTRDWDQTSERTESDAFGATLYQPRDRDIVERVAAVAAERGVSRAQVALAWVAQNPLVAAPIVGATKPHHINDALAALELRLTEDEKARLEEPYSPRELSGF